MKITIAALLASVATVVAEGNAPAITSPLGKCVMNMDCDNDYECAGGLLCADDHKSELQAAGFNTRTADCGMETENPLWEVCFDPCILAGSCPSGGGMGGKKLTSRVEDTDQMGSCLTSTFSCPVFSTILIKILISKHLMVHSTVSTESAISSWHVVQRSILG
jgi:hypothetical protein